MADPIKPLVNKVANSGIIVFNLEDHYPISPIVEIDLKGYLFKELILKEKDYRVALKELDWSQYQDKIVTVHCSTDAIIPVWAYMLMSSYLTDVAAEVYIGNQADYLTKHYTEVITELDPNTYTNGKVVIKGCSHKPVPAAAYALLTAKLKPHVRSIMYGEPCSTVPIYKRPRVVT